MTEIGTTAIVTDATADVPLAERNAVRGVPWIVVPERWATQHDEELRDEGETDRAIIDAVLGAGPPPEPTEPSRDDFVRVFDQLREVDRVFSVHSPSSVSWAVEHSREAAGGFPNVRVIEASVTGIGLGLLVTLARNLAASGAELDTVEWWLREHRDQVRMLVVPDRFDPTVSQRGLAARLLTGRSMLQGGSGGRMDRSRRLRSRRATVAAIEKFFTEHTTPDGENLHMAVGHGDAAGAVDPFLDLFERIHPHAEVELVGRVGPRLVQQIGARCVAAAWLQTSDVPLYPEA